jgi:arylsulfatase A-like enzyme
VGLLLSTLSELGLDNDTLIFFLSDNGGPVGNRSNGSCNGPLQKGKGSLFEGGVHVPFVVRWRGRLPEGKPFDQPVISMDIFQTAAAAAGVQSPTDRKMDGVDLVPYLLGQNASPPHERLFWRVGVGSNYAVREGRYKLIGALSGEPQLYDLESDIGETKDLASAEPAVRDRLRAAYDEWSKDLVPPAFAGAQMPRRKKPNPKP